MFIFAEITKISSDDLGLVDVGPLDSDGTSQSLHCLRSVCLRRPAARPDLIIIIAPAQLPGKGKIGAYGKTW